MTQSEPRYQGVPVFVAGEMLLVPSLSMLQFQQFFEPLKAGWSGGEDQAAFDEGLATYIPIIGAALRRNYPEITDQDLLQNLDLLTFGVMVKAVQNASGLRPVTPGEFKTQTTTAS